MPLSTTRPGAVVPDSLLRRTNPPPPPVRIGSYSPVTPAAVTRAVQRAASGAAGTLTEPNLPAVQATQLQADAQGIQNYLATTVAALPMGTVAQAMGVALQEASALLTPQALAVFAPVIEDFAQQMNDATALTNPEVTPAPATDLTTSIAEFLPFLQRLGLSDLQSLATGLQQGMNAQTTQHVQNQNNTDQVNADIAAGYTWIVQALASHSTTLAAGSPSQWSQLASQAESAGLGILSGSLHSANQAVTGQYAILLAESLASHTVVHGAMQTQSNHTDSMQKQAAFLQGVQSGIATWQRLGSLPPSTSLVPIMESAAAKWLEQEATRLLTRLKNLLTPHTTKPPTPSAALGDSTVIPEDALWA